MQLSGKKVELGYSLHQKLVILFASWKGTGGQWYSGKWGRDMFRPVVVSAGTTSVLGSVLTFKIVKVYVLSLTDSKSTYPTLLI